MKTLQNGRGRRPRRPGFFAKEFDKAQPVGAVSGRSCADDSDLECLRSGGKASATFRAMSNMNPEALKTLCQYLLEHFGIDVFAII